MNFCKKIRPNSLDRFIEVFLLLFLFSVQSISVQSQKPCAIDTVAPFCFIEGFTVNGNIEGGGSPIFFPAVAYDNCSGVINVEYFLVNEGRSISEGDILTCGNHLIQGIFIDGNENLTSCEFVVKVNCNVEMHPALFPYQQNDVSKGQTEKIIEEHDISLTDFELGSLSVIWESGKRGPGTVSLGTRDPGGTSYGIYQLSHKHGYLDDFFSQEGAEFKSLFGNLKPGTDIFNKVWKQLGECSPKEFRRAQHEYIKRSHYKKYADRVRQQIGLDIENYSNVLKDVLWSTAVQHGPFNNIFKNALQSEDLSRLSEKDIINKVYSERGRMVGSQLANFPRVGQSWKKSLIQRFKSEEMVALSRLDAYYDDYVFNSTGLKGQNSNVISDEVKSNSSDSARELTKDVATAETTDKPLNNAIISQDPPIIPKAPTIYNEIESNNSSSQKNVKVLSPIIQNTTTLELPIAKLDKLETAHGIQSVLAATDFTISPSTLENLQVEVNVPANEISDGLPQSHAIEKNDFLTYRILFVILSDDDASFPMLENLGIIIRDKLKHVDQTRYLIGEFDNLETAENILDQVKSRGYRAAVITRYSGAQFAGVVH